MARGNPLFEGFAAGLRGDVIPPAPKGRTLAPKGRTLAPLAPQAGFFDSVTRGNRPSLPWSFPSGIGGFGGGPSGIPILGALTRERSVVAGVSLDMATSCSTIATLIEILTVNAVGSGLTLSSKVDGDRLGIKNRDMIRSYRSAIEAWWANWANDRAHDLVGRATVHEIAMAGFRSWLVYGENLITFDWLKTSDTPYRTKIALLDPRQLAADRMMTEADGGWTMLGVRFSKEGRIVGYWLRPCPVGKFSYSAMPVYVPRLTNWGRLRVHHGTELIDAKQVRGMSPLAAALTPARSHQALSEFTLAAAVIQTAFAATIESDLPASAAISGLAADNPVFVERVSGAAGEEALREQLAERKAFYEATKISLDPGRISHLMPGDKFKLQTSETPNAAYEAYDRNLVRQIAKAGGSTYSDLSGDYSQESFSSSRMGSELPFRINLKRRNLIAQPIYQAIFDAAFEEAIALGDLEPPRGAAPFYNAREAYLSAKWLGSGRTQPDELKHVNAVIAKVKANLCTLADALAEEGLDLEAVIDQRKEEAEMLAKAGLAMGDPVPAAPDHDEVKPAAKRGK